MTRFRWTRRDAITHGLTLVICLAAAGWLTRAVARAREDARSCECVCHLSQLSLALMNYVSEYGGLPPANVADAQGKPLYSWRVLLLPFMEAKPLYDEFRLDEAWDGPHNRELHSRRPPMYFCPSDPAGAEKGFTSFVAVVGPGTIFPGGGKSSRPADVRDDPRSTLMIVETDNAGVHWMEPRDLAWDEMSFRVNDRSRPSISSKHHLGSYPGPHVATAHHGFASLPDARAPEDVKALLTIDGGEQVELLTGPAELQAPRR